MNVKKISEKHGVTKLLIKGTDTTFMNSLRRAVMNSVPTLAVENVGIYENNSVMFDEMMAHRLGLVPLEWPSDYEMGDKCKLMLEKEGPCIVYSKDIKSTDPKVNVVDGKIPIVKLKKGQKVKLEMTAVVGVGKEHSKWQPAIVAYSHVPVINVTKEVQNAQQVVEACPTHVLEVKARKVVLADPFGCILCGKCKDLSRPEGSLSLDFDEDSFVFMIEPVAGMKAKDILVKAAEALNEKSKELRKELKKIG